VHQDQDLEAQITELEKQLEAIPFLARRDDTFGRKPGETEAQHWLRQLQDCLSVKKTDPSLWDQIVRGD
jgi:hypothetical protein